MAVIEELNTYRSAATFCVAIVFMVTSTISVILRLIAKRISKQALGIEDYAILVAQLLVWGMGTLAILAVIFGGVGNHVGDLSPHQIVEFLKILVALQMFYGSTLGLIKISICLFYIRIFFTRQFKIAAYTVIFLIASWSVMVILTGFLLCTPLAFNWNSSIKGGHCADQTATFIAVGVLDLVIDAAVFALPIPMIWNLKVSKGNKVALFGIFGLGLFTMVISILRIQALVNVTYADITFTAAYPVLWSFLEPSIGITVACGPLFRPLLKNTTCIAQHFSRNKNSKQGGSGDSATFERLEEQLGHPLIDYPEGNIQTTVTARNITPNAKSDYLSQDHEVFDHGKVSGGDGGSGVGTPPDSMDGGIVVKKEWKMQRE